MIAKLITQLLNQLYPPFRRLMPLQTFRYAACGAGNTLLGIVVFFIGYNFIFQKELFELPFITIKPHVAAMILSFMVTFPLGFYLARYVVFSASTIRGRQQLFRYFTTSIGSVLLNYFNLKILVEIFHLFPTVSQIINTFIVVSFSYLMQKHFAFRHSK